MSVNLKGVRAVQLLSQTLAKAAAVLNEVRHSHDEAVAKVPEVKAALKKAGLLEDGSEKLADEYLGNHPKTLGVLQNVVDAMLAQQKKAQQKVSTELGAPAGEAGSVADDVRAKRASAITGYRRGDDDPIDAATQAMISRLGLPIGT
jgi:hypothetical protein